MLPKLRNQLGYTLIELLVVIGIVGTLAMIGLNFDFQKKTVANERAAFTADVENIFSSTKIQSLVGKGISVAGAIVVPDEVRVRVRPTSVAVVYYSGGVILGTGQTLAYPFRSNPNFMIGSLRIIGRDDSVTELASADFDVVYARNEVSFTGSDIAFATAITAELQVGYKNNYQAVVVDRRANRVETQEACTTGCCRERANYPLDGYSWNLPTLVSGQSSDSIVGTADIPNGTRTATRTFSCSSNQSFEAGAIVTQPAVCDAGYEWNGGSSSCVATSCASVSGLIVDGYSWNTPVMQLGTTSMEITGSKTVSHGTRVARRTFTCTAAGETTGNALTEWTVSCDTGYTWNALTASCDANACPAGNYESSGYVWTIPQQVSGNVSAKIESAANSVTNGTRTATRTFSCIAGVRTPGPVTENPAACVTGYFWSTNEKKCKSNVCEPNTTLTANGYIWNAPYQDTLTSPVVLTGNRSISGGTRTATATFTCDATGNRNLTGFSESAGICSAGYVWNSITSACVASSCFAKSYTQSDFVFALPTTASGGTTGVLTGTKTIANGVRTATSSFSCLNGTVVSGTVSQNANAVCNSWYTWNASSGLCEGALCAANPSYSKDGYVWNVPSVTSGQTSTFITGTKAITHGTIYAYRTFSCDAGTFSPNPLTQNPNGTCDSGYTWNLSLKQCEGIPCQAVSAYTASGFAFSIARQESGYSSPAVTGTKAVAHGKAIARATFACEMGSRSVSTWSYDPGICEQGYYWDGVAIACYTVLPPGGAGATTGITASNITGTSFTVSWQSATGAVSYEISRDNGVTWTSAGSSLSYSFTGLTPLTAYPVRLRAKSATETSSPSGAVTVTTILSAPILNAATNITGTTFTMNWTAVAGATSYQISINNGSVWADVWNVTTYTVSGLIAGSTYQTVVRAKYGSTTSVTSGMVATVTNQSVNCWGSIVSNAAATTSSTYTQTWNGSGWTPSVSWSYGAGTCGYSCTGGATWNGSSCVVNVCSGGAKAMVNPSNGKCYILSSGGATWPDARSACISLGGRLATINDGQIQSFLSSNGFFWPAPWVGANDIGSEGTWVWDMGDSWSYTYWNGGEPNNQGDEDCAQVNGGWNDLPCGASIQYICQKNV